MFREDEHTEFKKTTAEPCEVDADLDATNDVRSNNNGWNNRPKFNNNNKKL